MSKLNKKKNNQIDDQLKTKLTDTSWQRGLTWRKQTLHAVAEARVKGISEEEIFKWLKTSGLITQTANAIIQDSYYLEGQVTPTELNATELQEELDEENANLVALGKKPYTIKQWLKIRTPRMKV